MYFSQNMYQTMTVCENPSTAKVKRNLSIYSPFRERVPHRWRALNVIWAQESKNTLGYVPPPPSFPVSFWAYFKRVLKYFHTFFLRKQKKHWMVQIIFHFKVSKTVFTYVFTSLHLFLHAFTCSTSFFVFIYINLSSTHVLYL